MEVRARAPGKIILAGEHAVVHGSTAVAASIDLYTYVSLRFPTPADDDDTLKLELKDVALEFSWPVGKIKAALPESGRCAASSPTSCLPETIKSIATLVEEYNIPEAKLGIAAGVTAFLWLYTSIHGYKPAKVVVTSELPLGLGLGSSAALCVSVSAALLALSDLVNLDFSQQSWLPFGESELELVNKWAFEGEKIIHGKPSGIDNTGVAREIPSWVRVEVGDAHVAALVSPHNSCVLVDKAKRRALAVIVVGPGNMIKFRSGNLTRIKANMPLKMLITNTKVARNTKALVAGVSERKVRHPNAMTAVFTAVDSISNELATIIQSPASDDLAIIEKEEKLGELMEMNQGLLQCMGVSHASIETVLRTTLKYKLATKLTGAGGGGCVLTLLPASLWASSIDFGMDDLLEGAVVDKVIAELESCGFECLIAGIGGNGTEICLGASS
ncbi:hypothetical protein RJ640_017663 [Escallonia rubra]|uniref:mevalonate kinase n=1 Tax=Escallonia rubra TaxID=112253 RepID=A0AA88R484_9ASTE|nr:hypothetical protein RJ640_017663 [Escallonia rubra]